MAAKMSADAKAKKYQRDKSLNTREKVVCIAKSQVGVKERGVKNRKSNNCQKYFRTSGRSPTATTMSTATVYMIDGNGGRDDVRKGSHKRGGMIYNRMPS